MNRNFLLTYNYVNTEGMYDSDYAWFESEDELKEEVKFFKETLNEFEINEIFEIINAREIELE